jgi:hypothetical protein
VYHCRGRWGWFRQNQHIYVCFKVPQRISGTACASLLHVLQQFHGHLLQFLAAICPCCCMMQAGNGVRMQAPAYTGGSATAVCSMHTVWQATFMCV